MKIKWALISLSPESGFRGFFAINKIDISKFSIFGVDGRKLAAGRYFELGVGRRRYVMTPAEVGCALSHMSVYRAFLDGNEELVMVFEDDATLEREVPDFSGLLSDNKDWPIMICLGGQDGTTTKGRIHGVLVNRALEIWEVAPESYRCIWRTCGYALNRKAAELVLSCQAASLQNADMWHRFFEGHRVKVFYIDLISHPVDDASSTIASERSVIVGMSFLHLLVTKFIGMMHIFRAKIRGFQPIHKVRFAEAVKRDLSNLIKLLR